MNKKFIFVAAVFSVFVINPALAAPNPDDTFKAMDTNNDGFITKDELYAHHKKMHDAMDLNKDGKVSVEEAAKAGKSADAHKKVDTDSDGFVSFKEGVAVEEKRFQSIDTNKDGKVSKAEFDAHVKEVQAREAAAR